MGEGGERPTDELPGAQTCVLQATAICSELLIEARKRNMTAGRSQIDDAL